MSPIRPPHLATASNDNPAHAPPKMAGPRDKRRLDALRAEVDRLEGRTPHLSTSHGAEDQSIDLTSLFRPGRLAELSTHEDLMSADRLAVALGVMATRAGHILWIGTERDGTEVGLPYAPGLMDWGLDPARLLCVRAQNARDALWSAEEGLKTGALAGVILSDVPMDLVASRRLALAARENQMICLVLATTRTSAPAAQSRWRVRAEPGAYQNRHRVTRPRISLEAIKDLQRPAHYRMEFGFERYGIPLHPSAPLAGHALAADTAEQKSVSATGR